MTTERYVGAFFGEPWPSGICDDGTRVPTPVGENCILCGTLILTSHQGSFLGTENGLMPGHKECLLRSVMGGIGHYRDHGFWCLKRSDPDGGLSYRDSSLQVWSLLAQRKSR